MPDTDETISLDLILGGTVKLLQPRRGHRAGTDAVLVAATADIRPGDHVVDLGSASGAVGLMAAMRVADARILFMERDPDLVALCRRNIDLNRLGDRATALAADILEPETSAGPPWPQADIVLTNPPYFESDMRASPVQARRDAHVMAAAGLRGWLAGAARLLKPRGRLHMIHRADRLADCLSALRLFGGVRLRFVHPKHGQPATRVIVAATKAVRTPLAVLPPLVLHDAEGGFTADAEALHRSPVIHATESVASS